MSEQHAANVEAEDDPRITFSDDDLQEDSAPSTEDGSEQPGEQPEGEEKTASSNDDQGEDFIPDEELSEKVRKRIDRLSAEKYEAIRAQEQKDAELAELRRELEEREQQELTSRLEAPEPTPPSTDDYVMGADDDEYIQAHQKYIEDLRAYERERTKAELRKETTEAQRREEQERHLMEVEQTFNERVQSFKEQAPDYVQAVAPLAELNPMVQYQIKQDENGPAIAYYLAKNMDTAVELHNADPFRQGAILESIRQKVANAPKPKKVTEAGEPNETVQTGGGVSAKQEGPPGAKYE